jgi:hypothetical protein
VDVDDLITDVDAERDRLGQRYAGALSRALDSSTAPSLGTNQPATPSARQGAS